jgi:hypothetical protein
MFILKLRISKVPLLFPSNILKFINLGVNRWAIKSIYISGTESFKDGTTLSMEKEKKWKLTKNIEV